MVAIDFNVAIFYQMSATQMTFNLSNGQNNPLKYDTPIISEK